MSTCTRMVTDSRPRPALDFIHRDHLDLHEIAKRCRHALHRCHVRRFEQREIARVVGRRPLAANADAHRYIGVKRLGRPPEAASAAAGQAPAPRPARTPRRSVPARVRRSGYPSRRRAGTRSSAGSTHRPPTPLLRPAPARDGSGRSPSRSARRAGRTARGAGAAGSNPSRAPSIVPTMLDGTGRNMSIASSPAPASAKSPACSSVAESHRSPGISPIMKKGTSGTHTAAAIMSRPRTSFGRPVSLRASTTAARYQDRTRNTVREGVDR